MKLIFQMAFMATISLTSAARFDIHLYWYDPCGDCTSAEYNFESCKGVDYGYCCGSHPMKRIPLDSIKCKGLGTDPLRGIDFCVAYNEIQDHDHRILRRCGTVCNAKGPNSPRAGTEKCVNCAGVKDPLIGGASVLPFRHPSMSGRGCELSTDTDSTPETSAGEPVHGDGRSGVHHPNTGPHGGSGIRPKSHGPNWPLRNSWGVHVPPRADSHGPFSHTGNGPGPQKGNGHVSHTGNRPAPQKGSGRVTHIGNGPDPQDGKEPPSLPNNRPDPQNGNGHFIHYLNPDRLGRGRGRGRGSRRAPILDRMRRALGRFLCGGSGSDRNRFSIGPPRRRSLMYEPPPTGHCVKKVVPDVMTIGGHHFDIGPNTPQNITKEFYLLVADNPRIRYDKVPPHLLAYEDESLLPPVVGPQIRE